MSGITIVLILVALFILYLGYLYNKLVGYRVKVREAWSGIDVHLKERHNLIPNLVAAVKGYSSHEKGTLEDVTELRGRSESITNVGQKAGIENAISGGIGKIIALAEDYPDLKANENFISLQQDLVGIEDKLQYARRYYNGAVRDYNTAIQSVPAVFFARALDFKRSEFFEINLATERQVPDVSFEQATG